MSIAGAVTDSATCAGAAFTRNLVWPALVARPTSFTPLLFSGTLRLVLVAKTAGGAALLPLNPLAATSIRLLLAHF